MIFLILIIWVGCLWIKYLIDGAKEIHYKIHEKEYKLDYARDLKEHVIPCHAKYSYKLNNKKDKEIIGYYYKGKYPLRFVSFEEYDAWMKFLVENSNETSGENSEDRSGE